VTTPMEQWASGPVTRRWPGGSWVRRNKVLAMLIPVLLAAAVAGIVAGTGGGEDREPAVHRGAARRDQGGQMDNRAGR